MAEEIKISIGADTTQMQANLVKAQNTLKQFQAALSKATNIGEIKYLQRNIQALEGEISSLGAAMNSSSGAFNNLKKGSADATNTMTNLSRVVQDAPFGFMAISNNINPLIESFGRLKNETGSTSSAFSAMISSLSGPGGIGFVVSLATSAILGLSSAFGRSAEESKVTTVAYDSMRAQIDALATGYDNLASKLEFTSQLQIETRYGIKDLNNAYFDQESAIYTLKTESTDLVQKQLYYVNTYLPKLQEGLESARKAVLDYEFARRYGAGRGSFETDMEALNALDTDQTYLDLKKAYEAASTAFFKGQKESEDLRNNQILLNKKITNSETNLNNLKEHNAKLERERKNKEAAAAERARMTVDKVIAKMREDLKDQVDIGDFLNISTLDERISIIDTTIKKLISDFNLPKDDSRLLDINIQLNELQQKKFNNDVGDLINKLNADLREVAIKPNFGIADLKQQISYIQNTITSLKNLQTTTGNIVDPKVFTDLTNLIDKFREQIIAQTPIPLVSLKLDPTDFEKKLQAIGDIAEGMVNDFAISFAENIGKAFSGGRVNFIDSFYDILSNGLIQIGKLLIKIGGLAELVQKALANLFTGPQGPALAIIAGFSLIALGSAIKALKSSKFAVGTRFAPGGMALVGERGPELVNLPRGSQVIPAAQTSNMMGGIGGSVEVFGVLRGQDIYFSNKKYGQTYNRQT